MKQSTGDIQVITALRGIAALMVFFFHLICVRNGFVSDPDVLNFFYFGKFGVQFFFLISGFVILHSMVQSNYQLKHIKTFLFKRLIRIEPPYLVVLALTVVFLFVRYSAVDSDANVQLPGLSQILLHLGYLVPFSGEDWLSIVFWTLAIEFQFYLIICLTFQFFLKQPTRLALITILLALSIVIPSGGFFFSWSPAFLAGMMLALFRNNLASRAEFFCVTLVLFLSFIFQHGVAETAFAAAALLLIYLNPAVKNKILIFFGQISYSLYLLHTLVAFRIINMGRPYNQDMSHTAAYFTLAIVCTIASSYLLYRFVEKPCKAFASSLRYNKVSNEPVVLEEPVLQNYKQHHTVQ